MALSPEDVLNKTFTTTQFRRGYDEREVDDFLDDIVAEMRRMTKAEDEVRQQLNDCREGRGLEPVTSAVPVPAAVSPDRSAEIATLEGRNSELEARVRELEALENREQTSDAPDRTSELESRITELEAQLTESESRLAGLQGERDSLAGERDSLAGVLLSLVRVQHLDGHRRVVRLARGGGVDRAGGGDGQPGVAELLPIPGDDGGS